MAPICHPGPRYLEHQLVLFKGLEIGIDEDVSDHLYVGNGSVYEFSMDYALLCSRMFLAALAAL